MQKMTRRLTEELRRLSFESYDHCILCKYAFEKGDTAHLGYDSKNDPLYTCDKCSSQLKETAVRYYFKPRFYEVPEAHCKLWRYMNFAKYVSMLATNSLYFSRADKFNDLFEGAKGLKKNKKKWDEYYLAFFKKAIRNPPEGSECMLSDQEIDQQANKLLRSCESSGNNVRQYTFINCWHENIVESEAMWRLYSSFIDNAVAIRTSYKNLYQSFDRNPSIEIGRIKYINFNHVYADINNAFWQKRKSFEHEKEVRAIILDRYSTDDGKLMPCNLSMLIEEVFVSPKAKDWFISLINDVNAKYGIKVKVSKSELIEIPFF